MFKFIYMSITLMTCSAFCGFVWYVAYDYLSRSASDKLASVTKTTSKLGLGVFFIALVTESPYFSKLTTDVVLGVVIFGLIFIKQWIRK